MRDRSRSRSVFLRVVVAGTALLAVGCNTLHFEISEQPAARVETESKTYYLWGLFPEVKVDASRFCPDGVAAIREETRFVDGFFSVITLGLYSPRSTTYHCLERNQP